MGCYRMAKSRRLRCAALGAGVGLVLTLLEIGLGGSAFAQGTKESDLNFAATLRDMRAALREISSQRQAVKQRGDKLKEACLYERQRAVAQAVDSTEVAQVAWEAAVKQGAAGKERAQQEKARAAKASELVRTLRTAAEACVGEELSGVSQPTRVTVSGPGKLDDAQPGPAELVTANTARLELPSRPNPASAFRPSM